MRELGAQDSAVPPKGAAAVFDGDFTLQDAIGGWRGLAESTLPGVVFVAAFLIWGGFKAPVIASVSAVALMVALRLIQHTSATQAFGGTFGVALGAVWAWRAGDANAYFVPGLWITGAYTAALLVSMALQWPAAGIVVGLVRGWGSRWRNHRAAMHRFQIATGFYTAVQLMRLAIQVPLFLAGATAALGTAKLALGAPLFALSLWVVWLMVRNVELPEEPLDPTPLTR